MSGTIVQESIPAGVEAPDFTLDSTSGQAVTLSSFRGKQPVLLAFFPLAFTGTCTAELCSFTDNYDAFSAAGVAVLPISVDAVPSLKEFKAKYHMKTDLLSDFKRKTGYAYGVMIEERFFTNRAYFLIDKQGIVQWAFVEETPSNKRDDAEILAEIAKLPV
jgi:peroxiredoxin